MTNFRFSLKALTLLGFMLAVTSAANAQATRTWVSGVGDDVNPCSRTAPCKTFAGAISKTAAGGEIDAIDPGGFGTVTLTKSVTIDGAGTMASILAAGTNGVNVNDGSTATPNTIVVTLRNLSINGAGTGVNGVNFTFGKIVNIEHCQIFGFTTNGILASTNLGGGRLNIKDTTIFKATTGIRATSTGTDVVLSLDTCRIENNTTAGVTLATNGFASIRDSVINFNGVGVGISGSSNTVNILNSEVSHSTTGLSVGATTTARISGSAFIQSGTNFSNSGTIRSHNNNTTDSAAIPGTLFNDGLK